MARVRGIKRPHPLGSVASRAGVQPLTAASGITLSASSGVKISALPATDAANDTDQLEVNQGGTSRRVTLGQLTQAVTVVGTDIPNIYSYGADGAGGATDLAALDDMLAAQVSYLPRLHVWAKTSVDVGSLIPGSDLVDPMPYLQKIFTAFDTPGMQGRHFIFGRQRAWNFQTRPTTGLGPQGQYLTPPQRCTLEWQREFDFSTYADDVTTAVFIRRDGGYGSAKAVVGSVAKGATTITVSSGQASGLMSGQRMLLRNTAELTTLVGAFTLVDAAGTGFCARAEDLIVKSVSGDVITFHNAVQDTYDSSAVPVLQTYENEPQIRLINPMAIGPGVGSDSNNDDRLFGVSLGQNFRLEGGLVRGFSHTLKLYSSMGGSVEDLTMHGIRSSGAGGGITIGDATKDFMVKNCHSYGGGQMFMLSGSGQFYGISRDITFRDSVANHPTNGFSQHNLSERITYDNVTVRDPIASGIDIRCPNCRVLNSRVSGSLTNALIARINPNGLLIDGLTAENCISGVYLEDSNVPPYDYIPDNITVQNCVLNNIGGSGSKGAFAFVYSQLHGGSRPVLGKLRLLSNYVSMNMNTTAYQVCGKWRSPLIIDCEADAAPGTSPTGFGLLMDGAVDGVAGDGPSNARVIDFRLSSTYTGVSILEVTGLQQVSGSLEGTTTTEQQFITASKSLSSPFEEDQAYSNSGATAMVVFTLPACSRGRNFGPFYVLDADGLRLQAIEDDTIRIGSAAAGVAAGSITSTTIGAWIAIEGVSASSWVARVDAAANWTVA